MSTSLLYHGFGIRQVQYLATEYREGKIVIYAQPNQELLCCAKCRSMNVVKNGRIWRRYRAVPIGKKEVFVEIEIHITKCADCGSVRKIYTPFAEGKKRYIRAFERHVMDLSSHMTIQDVANHLGINWHTVKEIQKTHLKREFEPVPLKDVQMIAIDEISIGGGHKYLTIVLDLESGAVIFVGDGKGSDALTPFWRRIRRFKKNIKAVAVDMSPAYTKAVKENLKSAVIVYDHFHIIKLYNEKLSDLRRTLYNSLPEGEKKDVLKGSRWLLLKNAENLDKSKDEPSRLQKALALNEPLAKAYYMKDELNAIWHQEDYLKGMVALVDWYLEAKYSGVPMLAKFANTLMDHAYGILEYYNFPISTGPLEGTNNKIKTLLKQAYGYRDRDFFRLKILSLHKMNYKLVG